MKVSAPAFAGIGFAAGFLLGTLISPPEAKADEYTDQFVASEVGPAVCEYFDSTDVTSGTVIRIGELAMENLEMTGEQAGRFIRDSVDVYCPWHSSQLIRVAESWGDNNDSARHKVLR